MSGHKSTQSLAVYHRVSAPEKVEMGKALESTLSRQPVVAGPSSSVNEVNEEEVWEDMRIEDFDTFITGRVSAGPSRVFSGNCRFQNCNFYFNIKEQ